MANQITFTKVQIDRAKKDGNPLVAICFDDRHLTKEQGGRVGRIQLVGPTGKVKGKKLLDFMLKTLKDE